MDQELELSFNATMQGNTLKGNAITTFTMNGEMIDIIQMVIACMKGDKVIRDIIIMSAEFFKKGGGPIVDNVFTV